jgi:WD40 repeat protein
MNRLIFPALLSLCVIACLSCKPATGGDTTSSCSILVKDLDLTSVSVSYGDQSVSLSAGQSKAITLSWSGGGKGSFSAGYSVQDSYNGSWIQASQNWTSTPEAGGSYTYTFSRKSSDPYYQAVWRNDATPVLATLAVAAIDGRTSMMADGADAITFGCLGYDQFGKPYTWTDGAPSILVDGTAAIMPYTTIIPGTHVVTATAGGGIASPPLSITASAYTNESLYSRGFVTPESSRFSAASFSSALFAAGNQTSIFVWEMSSGAAAVPIKTIPVDSAVFDLAFLPDGSKLVASFADDTIRVIDPANGAEESRIAVQQDSAYGYVKIDVSPDGKKVLCALGAGCRALVYDLASGAKELDLNEGSNVGDAAFNPTNGDQFVYGTGWGKVKTCAISSSATTQIGDKTYAISAVAWSHDGLKVAAANSNGTSVWKISDKVMTSTAYSIETSVGKLSFSSDNSKLLLAADAMLSRKVGLWTHSTGGYEELTAVALDCETVLLGPGDKVYASRSDEGFFELSSAGTDSLAYAGTTTGCVAKVLGLAAGTGGVVAASDGARVLLWKADGTLARIIEKTGISALAYSKDAAMLAGRTDSKIIVWNASTGSELSTIAAASSSNAPVFSSDGTAIFADMGTSVSRYSISGGSKFSSSEIVDSWVSIASVSLDSAEAYIVAGGTQGWGIGVVRLWKVDGSNIELVRTIDPGLDALSFARITSDAAYMLYVGNNSDSYARSLYIVGREAGEKRLVALGRSLAYPCGLETCGGDAYVATTQGLRIIGVAAGTVRQVLPIDIGQTVEKLALSPDGNSSALASRDADGHYIVTAFKRN